jgi:hypothetical protein
VNIELEQNRRLHQIYASEQKEIAKQKDKLKKLMSEVLNNQIKEKSTRKGLFK